jgi:hypothetical protein
VRGNQGRGEGSRHLPGSQSVEYRKHLNGNTVLYHNWPLAGGRRGFSASKQRTVTLEHAGKADAAILHAAFGE